MHEVQEALGSKEADKGTTINPTAQGSNDTGNRGTWETWHGVSNVGTKGCRGKHMIYTVTYTLASDCNESSGRDV